MPKDLVKHQGWKRLFIGLRWGDHPITNSLMKRGAPAKSEPEETAKQSEKFSHAVRNRPHLSRKGKHWVGITFVSKGEKKLERTS